MLTITSALENTRFPHLSEGGLSKVAGHRGQGKEVEYWGAEDGSVGRIEAMPPGYRAVILPVMKPTDSSNLGLECAEQHTVGTG